MKTSGARIERHDPGLTKPGAKKIKRMSTDIVSEKPKLTNTNN